MHASSQPPQQPPQVSVLMPTYKQAAFIRRAIESLKAQTFHQWELIIVDDASPDGTAEIVESYLSDGRIRCIQHDKNLGVGAALNTATGYANGRYITYLPSDDVMYPEHLERLVRVLDSQPQVYAAYAGVRWAGNRYDPTLRGIAVVGHEAEALHNPPLVLRSELMYSGNLFALVQVMHRRDYEQQVRWATRSEIVTDRLEFDFWKALLACGATFQYAGDITCEWVDHPHQHHKFIAPPVGSVNGGGLARYRREYGISEDEPLNWQPSYGPRVDERARYGRFAVPRALPADGGLKILVVGSLGFNPERMMAFEERGHKLYGMWTPETQTWDASGPFPYGNITDIPYGEGWQDAVRAVQPDVIYGLLNWQAIPMLYQVLKADLGIPFVFHFKEGPFFAQEGGLWHMVMSLLLESDGQVYINQDAFDWYQMATDYQLDRNSAFILDGDLPKLDWFTDDWSPKLSAQDGELHTVCAGRPLGIEPFHEVEAAGIHLHFYGEHFHQYFPNFTRENMASRYLHLHRNVEPWEWVRELSQYDAAWFHVFRSRNRNDLRRATWDDLNMPARLGTYACAGLPWILKDNRDSLVGLQSEAQRYDVGVFFSDFANLAAQLRDRARLAELTENMRESRLIFAFDTHVDDLVLFFRRVIERRSIASSAIKS